MPRPFNNFVAIDSVYGKFIINRHCDFQAEHLIKHGVPHIQAELQNMLAIVSTLPPGCVIVDAGANAGLVSIPMAQLVKERKGTVYSFEIQRMMFYAVCGAAALNDLDNLIVYQKGLGAKRDIVSVPSPDYGSAQDFGLFSLVEGDKGILKPHAQSMTEHIEIRTLDELQLPRLDFLKIDVEGMELSVIEGGKQTIQKNLPWCWVEYLKVQVEPIKAQFAGLPYKFYVMDGLNVLCAPQERLEASGIKIPIEPV